MFNPFSQLRAMLWSPNSAEADGPAAEAQNQTGLAGREAPHALPREYRVYLEANDDLPTPFLNALDSRSPSYLDIIAFLIDTGKTPATRHDVQASFLAVHKRLPGPNELAATVQRVQEFGLQAD